VYRKKNREGETSGVAPTMDVREEHIQGVMFYIRSVS